MSENLKCVLDLLQNCIHNGHEVKKLCEGSPDVLKSSELIRQFIGKIDDETKALEKMRKKIFDLIESSDKKDYGKLKDDIRNMINSMDSISNENVNQVIQALMRSKTSKAMRNFSDFGKIVNDFKGDDVTKGFVNVLIERNQKIINCLNHVIHMLPIPKVDCNKETSPTPKMKKKLFIFSDDLQRTIETPDKNQMSKIGTVVIHTDGTAQAQTSSVTFGSQTITQRRTVNGFIQDEVNGYEVVLDLIEPATDNASINLINFSNTMGKLSASIVIDGEAQEDIEIFEINITDMPNEAIAVVENSKTGEREEVSVQIVATEPNNEIHGRIIEIKANEGDEAPISPRHQATRRRLGYSGRDDIPNNYINLLSNDNANQNAIQEVAEAVVNEIFNISDRSILLDDSEISLVDNSFRMPDINAPTPIQLSPQRTPQAPGRARATGPRRNLAPRGLQFDESRKSGIRPINPEEFANDEQIDDVDLQLYESVYSPTRSPVNAPRSSPKTPSRATPRPQITPQPKLIARPINPEEFANDEQIEDVDFELHESVESPHVSPEKFSPGKRYDSLYSHYVSPKKVKSPRRDFRGFGYGSPSQFRKRNLALVPSRVAIPDRIPPFQPGLQFISPSRNVRNITPLATPVASPSRSPRTPRGQIRQSEMAAASPPRNLVEESRPQDMRIASPSRSPRSTPRSQIRQPAPLNVSNRLNLLDDVEMSLINDSVRSPEVNITPLQMTPPKTPQNQRIRIKAPRKILVPRGLQFEESRQSGVRPINPEEFANDEQIEDVDLQLYESVYSPTRSPVAQPRSPSRNITGLNMSGIRNVVNESPLAAPRSSPKTPSRATPLRQITPQLKLIARPINPEEFANDEQIEDVDFELHESVESPHVSPEKFSPGKRYDSLYSHYVSPKKVKSPRRDFRGFGFGSPSQFRKRNLALVPSRVAIPDKIPPYQPGLQFISPSKNVRNVTPLATPAASPSRSPRTPRSQIRQPEMTAASPRAQLNQSMSQAEIQQVADAVTDAVVNQILNVSERSNLLDDVDMSLVNESMRSPEVNLTPLQLTTPKTPEQQVRPRLRAPRRILAPRGLQFEESRRSSVRPINPEELANEKQIEDLEMQLHESIQSPGASVVPSRTSIPDQARNFPDESPPQGMDALSPPSSVSNVRLTESEERVLETLQRSLNESMNKTPVRPPPPGPIRTPTSPRTRREGERAFDRINEYLDRTMTDYLDKTPNFDATPSIVQRSAYEYETPRSVRAGNASLPMHLSIPRISYPRSRFDDSLNTAREKKRIMRRLEEQSSGTDFVRNFSGGSELLDDVQLDNDLVDLSLEEDEPRLLSAPKPTTRPSWMTVGTGAILNDNFDADLDTSAIDLVDSP